MPAFDDLLKQAGEEKQGYLTKEGSEKTMIKGFFDNNDTNHDGKITREEWDASMKFMAAVEEQRLRPQGRRQRRRDEHAHVSGRRPRACPTCHRDSSTAGSTSW